jgi:hypothetical protein
MTRFSILQAIELFRRHPSDRRLAALHDGQIQEGQRARAQRHLDRCPACRLRAERIGRDLAILADVNFAEAKNLSIDEQALVAGVQDSIRSWRAEYLNRTEVTRRIEDVLGVYLGKRAAAALMQCGSVLQDSGQDSLANAGSTLRVLLGEKSARAVEARLLRIIKQVPESAGKSS